MAKKIRYVSVVEYDFGIRRFVSIEFIIDLFKLPNFSSYKKNILKATRSRRGSAEILCKDSYSRGDKKVKEMIESAFVKKEDAPVATEVHVACLYFYVSA